MKYLMIGLILVNLLMGLLWYAFGGLVLAVILVTLILVALLIATFALGSWWSSKLMERGARIALQAQTSDDRRDSLQINALTGLVKETLRIRSNQNNGLSYPSLPFGEETVDASFTIAGLEDE